jgi:pimeloyl-ACP methyl ester carboxylesterase
VQRTRTVIKVAGRNIAVQQLLAPGPVDKPTLVFLHEGLGSIALWRDFPTRLCGRLGLPGLV